jgi:mycofactocin system glycosyltransferase
VTQPVPPGWRLSLDPRTRQLDGGRTLLTRTGRLLRLGAAGPAAVGQLLEGKGSERVRALGRRLLDVEAAHPVVSASSSSDVTVVIPARDRTAALSRCLANLEADDVLVVDDGSAETTAVEAVCRAHGARYVRRDHGGPAAARNTAVPLLDKDFVAFLDSDCVPDGNWLNVLRGHLEDPAVVAAAPRVVGGWRSPLDLGPHAALVRPGGRVGYVPTACLLVRRTALQTFDEDLRYGEDVDLVWRLVDAGGQVRYDPTVVVQHEEPVRARDRLARRYRYGTSAAPLSRRHPGRVTHLVLTPWPTAAVALLLARRPGLGLVAAGWVAHRLNRQLHDVPAAVAVTASSLKATGTGLGSALALTGPLGWWAAARDRRMAALLVVPLLLEWADRRPPVDPLRYVARGLLDQAAYGAGVLHGCLRHRTAEPLIPRRSPPA